MSEHIHAIKSHRRLMYWGLIGGGLALVIWQFFTFMAVVKGHTAQAQKISQSASWSGQPVGTMPQTDMSASSGVMMVHHGSATGAVVMRTDLP